MKKLVPYIALVLILVVAVAMLMRRQEHVFDQRITFSVTDEAPYACNAIYRLLPKIYPGATVFTNSQSPVHWQVLSKDSANQVLLIVNDDFHPSDEELLALLTFAKKGNTVIISAAGMNEKARTFFSLETGSLGGAFALSVSLDSNVVKPAYDYTYRGVPHGSVITAYDTTYGYPLGYFRSPIARSTNLLGVHANKGNILLHTTPITFTNFFTLYRNNHTYVENILRLAPGKVNKVVWDEYFLYKSDNDAKKSSGILSVLWRYSSLRRAAILVSALLLLYMLTAVKRKQRMIPAYARPVNESLEFVKTVSTLYFEKGDHHNLAEKLTLYFLDYVRNRYKISTQHINAEFAGNLALKAGVDETITTAIVDSIHLIQLHGSISSEQLMAYHALLEKFYQKA
ncbi:DUF4350 domain-containing protein [Deminuibacter soli]|uniref:DUF4350 domain-containing protein n=1 Tax=Deminuibacter soli TaxID=2291815 RepID=A0A3E1NM04_9BACT|nr:DUF4350 domain-containing protein [Deminuibacter soli]RFM28966.1 DUF4350 domain-containing protein [Deminuibacter soli]